MMDKFRLEITYICGFLTPIVAYTFIFIAIANAPWFMWHKNALSDLGAHAGSDVIFNSGLMIAGILESIFAIGLLNNFKGIIRKIGAVILFLSAIALFGIGLFPETAGEIHFYFSVAFFVLFPIGIFVFSIPYVRKNENGRMLGFLAIGVFIASIIIWSFPWKSFGVTGVAIPEFLSSLCGAIWILAASFKLYKKEK